MTENKSLIYSFIGELWRTDGKGGWYFVTLPKNLSVKIRNLHKNSEEGWGRLKTVAKIKETKWSTSIWFDTKIGSYIIPLKANIRKKENLVIGSKIKFKLFFNKDKWLEDLIVEK